MEKAYQASKYNLNVARMTVDKRLPSEIKGYSINSCQCHDYPCKECHNRVTPSLDELSESKVEKMFSRLLAT